MNKDPQQVVRDLEKQFDRPMYIDPMPKGIYGACLGACAGVLVNVLEPSGVGTITAITLVVCGFAVGYLPVRSQNRKMSNEYRRLMDL